MWRCMQEATPLSRSVYPDADFEAVPFSPAWRWLNDESKRLLSSAGVTATVYWSVAI